MIVLKRQRRHGSHDGFRGALKRSADQDHMNALRRQTLCVGHRIGDEGGPCVFDEIQHIAGSRSGIQINKILGFDQRYRILCDLSLLFPVYLGPLCYRLFRRLINIVREYRSAKHLYQFSCLIQHDDISSGGRFRDIQKPCQFGHCHAPLLLQNLQDHLISLFR